MTHEKYSPLGYDTHEKAMVPTQKLPPQNKAQLVIEAARQYFETLENATKQHYGALLAKQTITLEDLETSEQEVMSAQSELSRKLTAECKQYGIATATIGGPLFRTGEESYVRALIETYTDLAALKKAHNDARQATSAHDRTAVLRALTQYREQYNGRNPTSPIKTELEPGKPYAEHFKNDDPKGELAYLVLTALDQEVANRQTPSPPQNASATRQKIY